MHLPSRLDIAKAQLERYSQGWDTSKTLLLKSERTCQNVLQVNLGNSDAYANLGVMKDLQGKSKEAIEFIK
jgi:hypothetical protein